jgi:hypothetical protein
MSHHILTIHSAPLIRTLLAIDILSWDLGSLILDDRLSLKVLDVGKGNGLVYSVFLFERMLMLCLEVDEEGEFNRAVGNRMGRSQTVDFRYPVMPWEYGLALRSDKMLNLVHAIPTKALRVLRPGRLEENEPGMAAALFRTAGTNVILSPGFLVPNVQVTFEIDWTDEDNLHIIEFTASSIPQFKQWITVLEGFVSSVVDPPSLQRGQNELIGLSTEEDSGDEGFEDEIFDPYSSWSFLRTLLSSSTDCAFSLFISFVFR